MEAIMAIFNLAILHIQNSCISSIVRNISKKRPMGHIAHFRDSF